MLRQQRQRWVVGAFAVFVAAACGSTATPSTTPTLTLHATSSATPSPSTVVTSTQYAWTQLMTASAPLARDSAGFAYDAATGTDLLTGGRTGCSPNAGQYVDTWSWNGSTWTQLHPKLDGPGEMAWFSMTYDAASGQEIAVGAFSGCGISTGMWTWNGSQWAQAPLNAALPDPLDSYSLAYYAATRTVILVGYAVPSDDGVPQLPGHSGPETWSWNGSHWTFLHPATSPPAVENPSIAYDAATQKVVLFGGEVVSEPDNIPQNGAASGATWLWNGTTWTEASAPASPPARFGASMAYDPDLGATVLFGGVAGNVTAQPPTGPVTVFDDMWSWNGTTWTQMQPASLPPGRFFSQMTYDATRHELVLFGGSLNANADSNDTWVFRTS
jgi:hypothetical protein